jgi:hypothetical protein
VYHVIDGPGNNTALSGSRGKQTTLTTIKNKLVSFGGSVKKSKLPFDDLTYIYLFFVDLYCVPL